MIVPAQREQHERFKAARARMEAAARAFVPAAPARNVKVVDVRARLAAEGEFKLRERAARTHALIKAMQALPQPSAEREAFPGAVRRIKREVCEGTPFTPDDLDGPRRTLALAHLRQFAMWRCRNETRLSWPEIGRRFGNRDHTTAIHAFNKIERERQAALTP